jgi:O-antigen/teichoic acid export membrane protein
VTAFATYGGVYFLANGFLARHYVALIWTVFLGLYTAVAVAGALRVVKVCKGHLDAMNLSMFLPAGFWKYTLGVQASSMLGLFSSLAGILTLNLGGVSSFGRFVALMAIVTLIDRPAQLVLSTFLPSLTNALELPEREAASAVVALWSRLLLGCVAAGVVLLSALAAPLVHLFGSGYAELVLLVPIACAGAAIDTLNQLAAAVLYAISRPYANMAGQLARLLVLLACFWPLWTRYHLLGTVLALIASQAAQCVVQIAVLAASKDLFRAALSRTLAPYAGTLVAVLICSQMSTGWSLGERMATSAGLVAAFFLAGRYTAKELAAMVRFLVPPARMMDRGSSENEGATPYV